MSRELLQQALNALLISAPLGHAMEDYEYRHRLIKDIEAELAKPEQELRKEWVGLTDGEIQYILDCGRGEFIAIQKAQQLLKDKNTT